MTDLVLQRLDHLAMKDHRPQFWARYIDDTFAVIECTHLSYFHNRLNEIFSSIQFTIEEESSRTLPLLDIALLMKECQRNADHTVPFESNHPVVDNIGVINWFNRINSNCSSKWPNKRNGDNCTTTY